MLYDIKPRLSPHMVYTTVRQRQFWDIMETAQHTSLDTAVANIWSDCVSLDIREVIKAPVTSSYRAFKQRMEDFFIPQPLSFYEKIGDDTCAPLFRPRQHGETMEEVLDRFWREALATCRGFLDPAVLFHATGGSNRVPWLAHRLAGVLYAPVHRTQMAAILLPVVTDILYNQAVDINDPDVWSSRLQTCWSTPSLQQRVLAQW